jgi:hypothetical protein
MAIRNVKILTRTVAENRAAQAYFFANGVEWLHRGKDIKDWGLALFVSADGFLTHGDELEFRNVKHSNRPTIGLNFEQQLVATGHRVIERPKTTINGRTYFKDEVDAALAKLETV